MSPRIADDHPPPLSRRWVSRPALPARPRRCPQLAFEQLARTGAREFRHEGHRAGTLVPGQVITGVPDHVRLGQRRPGRGHDGGMHLLTPFVRGDAEDRDVENARMLFQGGLDLGRVDVHAAGDDHVGLAVADVVVALVVPVGDVAHGVEIAVRRGLVAFRLLVVLVEDPGGPDVELAGMPGPVPVTSLPATSSRRIWTRGPACRTSRACAAGPWAPAHSSRRVRSIRRSPRASPAGSRPGRPA